MVSLSNYKPGWERCAAFERLRELGQPVSMSHCCAQPDARPRPTQNTAEAPKDAAAKGSGRLARDGTVAVRCSSYHRGTTVTIVSLCRRLIAVCIPHCMTCDKVERWLTRNSLLLTSLTASNQEVSRKSLQNVYENAAEVRADSGISP